MPDPRFVERDSEEWRGMWADLARLYGNGDPACEDPATGEVWHYMGTWPTTTGGELHHFRHRSFRGERRNVRIPVAHPGFESMRRFLEGGAA
jgi:hypothetical protein